MFLDYYSYSKRSLRFYDLFFPKSKYLKHSEQNSRSLKVSKNNANALPGVVSDYCGRPFNKVIGGKNLVHRKIYVTDLLSVNISLSM